MWSNAMERCVKGREIHYPESSWRGRGRAKVESQGHVRTSGQVPSVRSRLGTQAKGVCEGHWVIVTGGQGGNLWR